MAPDLLRKDAPESGAPNHREGLRHKSLQRSEARRTGDGWPPPPDGATAANRELVMPWGQLYGVQLIPVVLLVHEMVGSVHPELVNAVKPRTRPRTTLYFKRDMNTPFANEQMFRPREAILREPMRNGVGFNEFGLISH